MLQRGDKANSTIGEKSLFKGNFNVKGSLRIDGKYEGEHLTVEHLFVGPTGRVKTHIRSNSVVVEGLVIGTINAKTRVILHPAAKVLGDIKTPELIIQNGVILEGRCTISNNLETNSRQYIESHYNAKE